MTLTLLTPCLLSSRYKDGGLAFPLYLVALVTLGTRKADSARRGPSEREGGEKKEIEQEKVC